MSAGRINHLIFFKLLWPVPGIDASDLFQSGLLSSTAGLNKSKMDLTYPYFQQAQIVRDSFDDPASRTAVFAATKVWTYGRQAGIDQMQRSMQRMGVTVMDLMQIHNLRDWKVHLPTLRQWKAEGKIRYIGITTSHGRAHAGLL